MHLDGSLKDHLNNGLTLIHAIEVLRYLYYMQLPAVYINSFPNPNSNPPFAIVGKHAQLNTTPHQKDQYTKWFVAYVPALGLTLSISYASADSLSATILLNLCQQENITIAMNWLKTFIPILNVRPQGKLEPKRIQ